MNEAEAKAYLESLGYSVKKTQTKDERKAYQREYRKKRNEKFDMLHNELLEIYKTHKTDNWRLDAYATSLAIAAADRYGFHNSAAVVSGLLSGIAEKLWKESL